ncbi:MAG TPA: alpha-hydroxy acid oxidase [Chthoniobacterales bacterium]|jgi:4-hydroxymandelate oxidase|nr:alpha-hydroxy acid oxidase [Chthoniobacterales bacterium]
MKSDLLLNIADYARAARTKLPQEVCDYYEGGALDEVTLRENTDGWTRLKLYYRVLAGVAARDLRTTVLGQPVSMPILVAPTAFHKLACEAGEKATARAAKAAGTLFILSSLSNTAMELVFAQAGSPRWFQLYVYKDREITRELVQRAEAAGAEAIVLTVDAPGLGTRERDARSSFRLPDGLVMENLAPLGKGNFPEVQGSGLAAYARANFKSDLGFDDLDWLCQSTCLPVVVKGVCRGDDARRAAEHGAKAVVVSNHGGRQLDTAPATCEVLPHVVEAAGDLCEIYVDGGIRRGSDVLKALALGARAVLVGRPVLWGLCVGGEDGALQVMEILRRELDEAMLLCGCSKLGDIDRALLQP